MTKPIGSADPVASLANAVPLFPAGAAPIPPWPGETVRLGADEVFVRSAPAGPGAQPAVYVHGLGGSALNWTDLMGQLSQPAPANGSAANGSAANGSAANGSAANGSGPSPADVPLLAGQALDLPGFGYSPPPAGHDYSLDGRVATVIALIEQHDEPVHLIGNSLGGAVSTRVAARRPDLFRTLTLISPAMPDLRPRLLPARLALVSTPGIGRFLVNKMLAMPAPDRTDRSIAELYADPSRLRPQRRDEAIAEMIRRDGLSYATDALLSSGRALVSEYARPRAGSLWRDAARVTAPTLVIHGSHDRLVDPAMAGRAARTFPDCRVVVLPRVGHVAMMERPELVAAERREFLRGALAQQVLGETTSARGSRRQGPASAGGRSALSPASP